MKLELAKRLKEAGYESGSLYGWDKETEQRADWASYIVSPGFPQEMADKLRDRWISEPDTDELWEALKPLCAAKRLRLELVWGNNIGHHACAYLVGEPAEFSCQGDSPAEALAELWIAINNNDRKG